MSGEILLYNMCLCFRNKSLEMFFCRDLVYIFFGIEYFLYFLKYKSFVIGYYCVFFVYVYIYLMERYLFVGYDNY